MPFMMNQNVPIHFFDLFEKIEGYVFLFKEDFLVSSMHGGGHNEFSFFHNMLDSPAFSLDRAGVQMRIFCAIWCRNCLEAPTAA